MSERIDNLGRIVDPNDAHELAELEENARKAKELAGVASELMGLIEEPSDDALEREILAHEEADRARKVADEAVDAYVNDPDKDDAEV